MPFISQRQPRAIPEPESTDEKEVFAFFGLCSYCAQVLEGGLINLAVVLHSRGLTSVTWQEIEAAFERIERKTFGQLMNDVRRRVTVSAAIEAALEAALRDRNYLAHRFWATHDVDFGSNPGRKDMIEELRKVTARFQTADRLLEAITLPLWEDLGISQSMMESELAQMRAEAEQRDSVS